MLYKVIFFQFFQNNSQFIKFVVVVIFHLLTDVDGFRDVLYHITQQLATLVKTTMSVHLDRLNTTAKSQ